PAFDASCREWLGLLGDDEQMLASFMCGSVACRIGVQDFNARCLGFGGDLKMLLTFMKGGVACRIGDPPFDAAVDRLLKHVLGNVGDVGSARERGLEFRVKLLSLMKDQAKPK
ncbi:hypothetical protein B484DRAFT_409989, partial [Ochromonadaceae sp. CCMP2298]